jgi:hypothetical protein
MSVNVTAQGVVKKLDLELEAPSPVDEKDVVEPSRLARLLLDMVREIRRTTRLWRPRRIDFMDRAVDNTGTTLYRFEHRFEGDARYWVVDWIGDAAPNLQRDPATTPNTLVLTSTVEGLATIRVEEAG